MNIGEVVNDDEQLEAMALQLLRSVPGVEAVETAAPVGSNHRVDGIVRFSDRRAPVVFEVKRHANAATAWQLIGHARHLGGDPYGYILIAGDTTAEARTLLAEHGIGLIDGLGNAHVELPGLLIHLEQRRPKTARPNRPTAPRLTGKAGVIAQALLLEPERAWKVADVAVVADVSAGLAHRVLARLESENVMTVEGAGPRRKRRVVNPAALLDLWSEETEMERPHRVLAYVVARTAEARTRSLARNLDATGVPYAITGAAAAAMLAPLLTASPTTEIWLPAKLLTGDALTAARAEPVTEGANVVLLQARGDAPLAFARRHEDISIANVFRLYADLRRDPRRGREQADNLRRQVIGF
ncbi:MAG: type IV toxin-antitoxin system AbiEi family antitoxin [Jatrophihabitantaceae bacterium]